MASFEERVYWAWLAGATPSLEAVQKALGAVETPEAVLQEIRRGNPDILLLFSKAELQKLKDSSDDHQLSAFQNAMDKENIQALTPLDHRYPIQLLDYDHPPFVLFWQGNCECLQAARSLAVVGSRRASPAGLIATRKFARSVSEHGVSVISGLAYGIDSAAHKGCVEGGSPTIAVLGCGLDIQYPSGNQSLKKEILNRGGLIISEFAPGEQPIGYHFPFRNRIISGLSCGVVLMEARIRSGSMTTIHHALNQGKEVFVYPGDPLSEQFSGNHILLREGARFFTRAEDVLEDMEWLDNQTEVGQNSGCVQKIKPGSPAEKAILSALSSGSLSFEQISQKTGLTPPEIMTALTMLQIHGAIEALPGKSYQISTL